ncbi:E3 SUMO-protein ligase ZBED1-like [Anastrepha ludens]|uniref:E3 SUMO-protein ligase ZBED1-like n=1 Tax=Anastrepha ludens TaxID=28586 RepID=UPI0023AF5E7B|nr:E3 SUMO-protein ligase ZBED1-like [Anastrepha ludens]
MHKYVRASNGQGCSAATIEEKEQEEEPQAKKARYGQSNVWNFFNKSSDGKTAKCLKCGKIYQTSGNTTNMAGHLKRVHPTLTVSELPKASGHMAAYLDKKYEASSKRKRDLDSALLNFICSDLRPFYIVENEGFKQFVNALDPRYELPSRSTLLSTCYNNLFMNMRMKLKSILQEVEYCAVTTDCWTSRANEAYLTVTCHFIDPEFKLRTAVLSTSKLQNEKNHSAENIANSLCAVLIEWEVMDKVAAIVTDSARTMIKACEILQKRHVPCFAHVINLIVQQCLNQEKIKVIMGKCKSIVGFFKKSTVAYAKFKEAQNTEKPYSLKQECPTRWNSAFHMIERILKTNDAISSVLLSTPKGLAPFSADEILILKDIKILLQPFECATLQTSSRTLVTVSLIIPITCGLLHNLQLLKNDLKTVEGRESCNCLLEGISSRLLQYEIRNVPRVATLLDPRFKKEAFHSPFNITEAQKLLENELSFFNAQKSRPCDEPRLPTSTSTSQTSLFQFLEKNKSLKHKTNTVDSILSIRQYFNLDNLESNSNPLDYWKISSDKSFQHCCKKYFCVPATSTESERIFSKAGIVVSEKRSSLQFKHVDMLLFINRNKWISEQQ